MNTLVNDFVSPRILYCGLGFVITGLSGILLSHSGRPLNSMIFAVHKLVAVATIILTVVSVRDLYKSAAIQAPQPALIGIMALVFVALLASGALLSFDKLALAIVLRVHQVAPLLAMGFTALTIYWLAGDKS
ncbi:MAG: hypothetical protein PVH65_14415 [Chloroflexota bacterium]|jgi:hypothetical protein